MVQDTGGDAHPGQLDSYAHAQGSGGTLLAKSVLKMAQNGPSWRPPELAQWWTRVLFGPPHHTAQWSRETLWYVMVPKQKPEPNDPAGSELLLFGMPLMLEPCLRVGGV